MKLWVEEPLLELRQMERGLLKAEGCWLERREEGWTLPEMSMVREISVSKRLFLQEGKTLTVTGGAVELCVHWRPRGEELSEKTLGSQWVYSQDCFSSSA